MLQLGLVAILIIASSILIFPKQENVVFSFKTFKVRLKNFKEWGLVAILIIASSILIFPNYFNPKSNQWGIEAIQNSKFMKHEPFNLLK